MREKDRQKQFILGFNEKKPDFQTHSTVIFSSDSTENQEPNTKPKYEPEPIQE